MLRLGAPTLLGARAIRVSAAGHWGSWSLYRRSHRQEPEPCDTRISPEEQLGSRVCGRQRHEPLPSETRISPDEQLGMGLCRQRQEPPPSETSTSPLEHVGRSAREVEDDEPAPRWHRRPPNASVTTTSPSLQPARRSAGCGRSQVNRPPPAETTRSFLSQLVGSIGGGAASAWTTRVAANIANPAAAIVNTSTNARPRPRWVAVAWWCAVTEERGFVAMKESTRLGAGGFPGGDAYRDPAALASRARAPVLR